ncbi:unnamed protein product [Notodromas monacha]|uniref:Mesencephalic astrocyte-derived neurotrophic factor homolog n=1 Tax=Notodromas monacha TaxID=399045 RepID=A0A7R9GDV8_9CRUS|nr:unnamed protein product [Notodromas monacha]CAG0917372.1 unnamed protein product [Notodromas monacha]
MRGKDERIRTVLDTLRIDVSEPLLEKLRTLAIGPGGLLKDDFRREAWPLFLGVHKKCKRRIRDGVLTDHGPEAASGTWAYQVEMDVRRTLKRFPPGIDDVTRGDLQKVLVSLMCKLLKAHPERHYYQGFHDMALTVLLVMRDPENAYVVIEALMLKHLRVFMKPTMLETASLLGCILAVIERENRQLYMHLLRSNVGTTFSLPWVLTWFSHCLDDYELVVRVFDAFLSIDVSTEEEAVYYPLAVSATVILENAAKILSTECELSSQHAALSPLPQSVDWDSILEKGWRVMGNHSFQTVMKGAETYRRRADMQLDGVAWQTPGLWEAVWCVLPFQGTKFHPAEWPPIARAAFFGERLVSGKILDLPTYMMITHSSALIVSLVLPAIVAGLKASDCEVCFKVIDDFRATLSDDELKNTKVIEKKFVDYCEDKKGKENRFCYYLGGLEESATGILTEVSKPLSYSLPTEKLCEKLKKKDAQICELRFDKQIDFKTVDLKKLKVRDLRKILNDWGEDCDGCIEKAEYIKRIEALKPKYVKEEL